MTPLLEACGVSIVYGGVHAVRDLDLEVHEGHIVGLIGPNGAGKTTLVDAITGFVDMASGSIRFAGRSIDRAKPHDRVRLGLVRTFQSVELFDDLTVGENLLAAADTRSFLGHASDAVMRRPSDAASRSDWALRLLGLGEFADRWPRELSGAQRRLVGTARALAVKPRLILLDEPGAGLDTHESERLADHLRGVAQEGITILLVDHNMGLVLTVCDHVYVLEHGSVIATGTPGEIRADPRVITAYLGTDGHQGRRETSAQ